MNGFFGNLHWRMPMQSTPTHRWATWARSLSAGRRRIYSRHAAAVMQLLRPAIPIHRSSHRWVLHAWSLFPRINLVVLPVSQQLVDKRSPSVPGSSAQRSSGAFRSQKGVSTPAQGSLKSGAAVAEVEALRASPGNAQAMRVAEVNPALAYSDSMQAPLNRVFRRLISTDIQTEHRQLITKESLKVARRVVEETRRVERYGPTSMVTKQDAMAGKILDSARRSETKLQEQLTELSKTVPHIMHGRAPLATPISALTIEQLTEQVMRRIDDQILAHKERMGKVF